MVLYQQNRFTSATFYDGLRAVVMFATVLMILLWATPATSEPRCTAATTSADDLTMLGYHSCDADFKAWASDYFRYEKKHWDEGWGWVRCGTARPFGKMLNAAMVLSFGIEPWEEYARAWYLFALHNWEAENATLESDNAGPGMEISPEPSAYQPAAFYQADFDFHVVSINDIGDLIHYRGGQTGGDWFADNITHTFVNAAARTDHRLKENPIYVTNGTYDHFFGLSEERDVVMYQRHGLGGPWWARNLTKDLTNRSSLQSYRRLTAVNHDGVVSAFGINRQGHLIRYRYGSVQNITQGVASGGPNYLLNSRLMATVHFGRMHVYALNGERVLTHYYQTPAGQWTAELVSTSSSPDLLTNSVQPTLVEHANGTDTIYGVTDAGHLMRYERDASGNWSVSNITETLSTAEGLYDVDHRYALSVISAAGSIHVFGINSGGDLIHYSVHGDMASAENVTSLQPSNGARFKASLSPTAVNGAEGSLHIYIRGLHGQLYHFYRSPSANWRADDITTRVSVGVDYNILGKPIVLERTDRSHHVMSVNGQGELIHYYTSRQAHAWHASRDYAWLAAGSVHDFSHKPEDRWDSVASAQGGFWQRDQVKMKCPTFDGSGLEGGPDGRAAAMLHEAIHVIYWRWSHQQHPTAPDENADNWFAHGVNDYPPGTLNLDRTHSMYQIQVEFLSDLGEFPAKWVPLRTSTAALDLARIYMFNIIGPPAWVPGDPRPL